MRTPVEMELTAGRLRQHSVGVVVEPADGDCRQP
jgi:hypothetical protein